jgi:hypothetical protein
MASTNNSILDSTHGYTAAGTVHGGRLDGAGWRNLKVGRDPTDGRRYLLGTSAYGSPRRGGGEGILEVVHEGEPGTTTTICRIPIDYDGPTDMTCEQVRDGVYRLDHRGLLSFWAEVELIEGPPEILPPL